MSMYDFDFYKCKNVCLFFFSFFIFQANGSFKATVKADS